MSILKSHAIVSASALLCIAPLFAQDKPSDDAVSLPSGWEESMRWRSIGPANMGGRITDIAVHPGDTSTWWIGTATGGVLKTTNDGNTFEHLFTQEGSSSIGAIAVAQSDPDTLWVGTGERNPRNSVSWGDGVYKSIDAGATWTKMGLEQSFQIGSIIIDPSDSNTVYVGALGRLWGESDQRGLYKTVDGGENWERILEIDTSTGIVDIVMHPDDSSTLLVAGYERERDAFCTNDPAQKWGAGSGLWRTTDAGRNFTEITDGLPDGKLGRIGLEWNAPDPNVVYMVLESEHISQEPENAAYAGVTGADAEVGARVESVVEDGPAAKAGLQEGDIVLQVGNVIIHSWSDLLDNMRQHVAGETVGMVISREREGLELEVTFEVRPSEEEDEDPEEGKAKEVSEEPKEWKSPYPDPGPFRGTLGGQTGNVQSQQGPDGHRYGGVYKSDDSGATWTRINSLNPRPMYYSEVRVDPSDSQNLYVLGTRLHRSKDGGETFTNDGHGREVHVDHHALWINPNDGRHMILGNDGGIYVTHDRMENWDHHNHVALGQFYHVTTDSQANYKVYGGLQDNGTWGGPSRTGTRTGPVNTDWMSIGGGDGFVCRVDAEDPDQIYYESQNGGIGQRNLRTGERGYMRPRAPKGTRYRFNWMTPFILSNHNSQIYYTAGNHVFRSLKKGSNLKAISPEITRTNRGSATALAESSRDQDELWVGTDDGAFWSTHDGGQTWVDHFEDRFIEEDATSVQPDPSSIAAVTEESSEAAVSNIAEASFSQETPDTEAVVAKVEEASSRIKLTPAAKIHHPLAGSWSGQATGAEVEGSDGEFELDFELNNDGKLIGELSSPVGKGAFKKLTYDESKGKLNCTYDADGMSLVFDGDLVDGNLTGTIDFAGGAMKLEFTAQRSEPEASVAKKTEKASSKLSTKSQETATDDLGLTGQVTLRMSNFDSKSGSVKEQEGTIKAQVDAALGEETEASEEVNEEESGPTLGDMVPVPHRISGIVTSRHKDDRVYVSFDGHRTNDTLPHIYASEDGGETWSSIRGDLPDKAGSVRTIEEDRVNPDLLYVGTERGIYASLDRGNSWTRMHSNLPTVPVHAIAQAPGAPEIVAGTHGRSLWVLNVAALRQMTSETLGKKAHLFTPAEAIRWRTDVGTGSSGTRRFVGENPEGGARIDYLVGKGARSIELRITGKGGELVREFEIETTPGLHSVSWDMRMAPPAGSNSRWRRGPSVEPGNYMVELTVDGTTERTTLKVSIDPDNPDPTWMEFEDFEETIEEDEASATPARTSF